LASSRASQNQIDLTDVAVAWAAFEEINSVHVYIKCTMERRGDHREPQLMGVATPRTTVEPAQKPWGSLSANSWVLEHRSLDSAVFHLLYTLDGLIAAAEMLNAGK